MALCGAFDLDAHDDAGGDGLSAAAREELLALARRLGGAPASRVARALILEATGGLGLHVWVLLAAPTPARAVVGLLDEALTDLGLTPAARVAFNDGMAIERYPKRADLAKDQVGTALRVPLGRHARTGRRSTFVDPTTGTPVAPGPVLRAPGAILEVRPAVEPLITHSETAPGRSADGMRPHPAPDAWLTSRWLAEHRGVEATEKAPPADGRGHPVRCLFPGAHAHGDLPPGSAYLIRDGEAQLYGCAVCGSGRAVDTIGLVRRSYPALDFRGALALCHEIDPAHCPPPR